VNQRTPLELIVAYQDAWTNGRFQEAADFLSDNVEFRSPQQHIVGAPAFLEMLKAFAQRIGQGWELIAATPSDASVLILYKLFMPDGTPALCSDNFSLANGYITAETLVFDPAPFAP